MAGTQPADASLPSPTWRAGGAPSADLPNMAAAPLPLPLAARLWRPPRPSPPRPSPPCPRPRGEAAPHLRAMGRASGRLPAAAPLFYGALAALTLLGVRDVLFLYEENRCSMTYMFEYPEYLVSEGGGSPKGRGRAADGAGRAAPPQQVGGSQPAPSAAGGRRGGGLAGSREGRKGSGARWARRVCRGTLGHLGLPAWRSQSLPLVANEIKTFALSSRQ